MKQMLNLDQHWRTFRLGTMSSRTVLTFSTVNSGVSWSTVGTGISSTLRLVEDVTGDGAAVVVVVVVVVIVVVGGGVVEVVVVVDLAFLLLPPDGLSVAPDEPRRPFWNLRPVTLLM